MWNLFKRKKKNTPDIYVSIPEKKRHAFSKLAEIIQNPNLISNVCQLNYNDIKLSSLELEVLQQLEKRSGRKVIAMVSEVVNRPLKHEKLSGWRFTYNQETFDIFTNQQGTYFIGQSSQPNHQVFNLNHDYLGEILSYGPRYEYEILFNLVEDCLFNKLLDTPYSPKYEINLETMKVRKIFN